MQARWCKVYFGYLRDPKLSLGARVTLAVLRSYCPPGRFKCFPSIRTLQRDLGCSRRSLMRYLDELERRKWIKRKERLRKDGSRTSSCFTLLDDSKSLVKEAFKRAENPIPPSVVFGTGGTISEDDPDKIQAENALARKIIRYPSV